MGNKKEKKIGDIFLILMYVALASLIVFFKIDDIILEFDDLSNIRKFAYSVFIIVAPCTKFWLARSLKNLHEADPDSEFIKKHFPYVYETERSEFFRSETGQFIGVIFCSLYCLLYVWEAGYLFALQDFIWQLFFILGTGVIIYIVILLLLDLMKLLTFLLHPISNGDIKANYEFLNGIIALLAAWITILLTFK